MQKNTIITVVVGLLVLSVIVIAVAKSQSTDQNTASNSTSSTTSQEDSSMSEDLKIEDITVGEGEEAVAGKEVTVHYTGTFTNGTKFDSSASAVHPEVAGWLALKGLAYRAGRQLSQPET